MWHPPLVIKLKRGRRREKVEEETSTEREPDWTVHRVTTEYGS